MSSSKRSSKMPKPEMRKETSVEAAPSQVPQPLDADPYRVEFLKAFSELIAKQDVALYLFLEAYEFRKGFAWLDEANVSRGLTNALLQAITAYPSAADLETTPSDKAVPPKVIAKFQEEWPTIGQSLHKAAQDLVSNHDYSLVLLRKIQARNKWDLRTAARRLLLGYASSSRYALSGDPW
jgi:hypothetical protein